MNAAAKFRPHQTLARRRREKDPDRLLDVLFHLRHGNATRSRIDPYRKFPAAPEKRFRHHSFSYPISTVGSPRTMAFGAPASTIWSPWRAAGSPLIKTLVLPTATTPPTCGFSPSTKGQAWKSAVALHAGLLPIRTLTLPMPGANGVPWLV